MIRLEGVARFYGEKVVLRKLDCSFSAGQVSLVSGENGAGKSTLLQVMAGLTRPSMGNIYRKEDLRIGFLGHATFVYDNLTAIENLDFWNKALGLGLKRPELLASLEHVGLGRHADEQARVFSRGMSQRLALARILISDPDLLLLDEPATGLDAGAHSLLAEEIRQARIKGKCVVMVSHDLAADMILADRQLVLARGRINYDGPPADRREAQKCCV